MSKRAWVVGLSCSTLLWLLLAYAAFGQPNTAPNTGYGSAAGDVQRAKEYDRDGDHVGVNLRAISGTPTPAAAGRCAIRCVGPTPSLQFSVGGGAYGPFGTDILTTDNDWTGRQRYVLDGTALLRQFTWQTQGAKNNLGAYTPFSWYDASTNSGSNFDRYLMNIGSQGTWNGNTYALRLAPDGSTGFNFFLKLFNPTTGISSNFYELTTTEPWTGSHSTYVPDQGGRLSIQTNKDVSVASNGNGAPVIGVLDATKASAVSIDCLDPDGCEFTNILETTINASRPITIINVGANTVTMDDSGPGGTNLAGPFAMTTGDTLSVIYSNTEWDETSRSDNN